MAITGVTDYTNIYAGSANQAGSTNDPDGKIAKENAEKKAKEKKEQEEKAAKRREEKKAEEEKAAERRTERSAERKEQIEKLTEGREAGKFTVSAAGTDVKSVTQSLISKVSGTSAPTGASFDIKA